MREGRDGVGTDVSCTVATVDRGMSHPCACLWSGIDDGHVGEKRTKMMTKLPLSNVASRTVRASGELLFSRYPPAP